MTAYCVIILDPSLSLYTVTKQKYHFEHTADIVIPEGFQPGILDFMTLL